jgi:hypothetical protein
VNCCAGLAASCYVRPFDLRLYEILIIWLSKESLQFPRRPTNKAPRREP